MTTETKPDLKRDNGSQVAKSKKKKKERSHQCVHFVHLFSTSNAINRSLKAPPPPPPGTNGSRPPGPRFAEHASCYLTLPTFHLLAGQEVVDNCYLSPASHVSSPRGGHGDGGGGVPV